MPPKRADANEPRLSADEKREAIKAAAAMLDEIAMPSSHAATVSLPAGGLGLGDTRRGGHGGGSKAGSKAPSPAHSPARKKGDGGDALDLVSP